MAEELRLAVTIDVDEVGRLAVGDVEDVMPSPVAGLALRIFEDEGGLARQAVDQDVGPAIAIEVIGELDEVVGVAGSSSVGRLARAGGVVALRGVGELLLEVRSAPNVATSRHVRMAVVVEVGDRAAFGYEVLGQGLLVERQIGADADAEGRGQEEGGEESHGGTSNTPPPQFGCEEFFGRSLIESL